MSLSQFDLWSLDSGLWILEEPVEPARWFRSGRPCPNRKTACLFPDSSTSNRFRLLPESAIRQPFFRLLQFAPHQNLPMRKEQACKVRQFRRCEFSDSLKPCPKPFYRL